MADQNSLYQVGDLVIHWMYGPGTIVQFDIKELDGRKSEYYVVRTRDLTIWVPICDSGEKCLRKPTPAIEFKNLFKVLASNGEPLSTDRLERKLQLTERMKSGSLEEICTVVRDLISQKRSSKMNENDNATLERARSFLLSEWSISFDIPVQQANRELESLLSS
jgi:RNA polymerase-interacting CarD/CdnL/TRCF family regulator